MSRIPRETRTDTGSSPRQPHGAESGVFPRNPRKPLQDPPIDCIIRLLTQAAGIAQRKRMRALVRFKISSAMLSAFDEAERLRAKKRK